MTIKVQKAVCPHCKTEIDITDNKELYILNRLGQTLCKCSHCKKVFMGFCDGNTFKVMRISK